MLHILHSSSATFSNDTAGDLPDHAAATVDLIPKVSLGHAAYLPICNASRWHRGQDDAVRRVAFLACAALLVAGCSDDAGVPSPEVVELGDGSRVWVIEDAECSEDSACGLGVYINRWYYGIECSFPAVEESQLGDVFAVGEDARVEEARIIAGRSPSSLALRLREPDCDGWVASDGQFDNHGLDDPPSDPKQAPPPE